MIDDSEIIGMRVTVIGYLGCCCSVFGLAAS